MNVYRAFILISPLIASVAACGGGEGDTLPGTTNNEGYSSTLGPDGGRLIIEQGPLTGFGLLIPEGALEVPTIITIRSTLSLDSSSEFAGRSRAVEILPRDISLKKPVKVQFLVDLQGDKGRDYLVLDASAGLELISPDEMARADEAAIYTLHEFGRAQVVAIDSPEIALNHVYGVQLEANESAGSEGSSFAWSTRTIGATVEIQGPADTSLCGFITGSTLYASTGTASMRPFLLSAQLSESSETWSGVLTESSQEWQGDDSRTVSASVITPATFNLAGEYIFRGPLPGGPDTTGDVQIEQYGSSLLMRFLPGGGLPQRAYSGWMDGNTANFRREYFDGDYRHIEILYNTYGVQPPLGGVPFASEYVHQDLRTSRSTGELIDIAAVEWALIATANQCQFLSGRSSSMALFPLGVTDLVASEGTSIRIVPSEFPLVVNELTVVWSGEFDPDGVWSSVHDMTHWRATFTAPVAYGQGGYSGRMDLEIRTGLGGGSQLVFRYTSLDFQLGFTQWTEVYEPWRSNFATFYSIAVSSGNQLKRGFALGQGPEFLNFGSGAGIVAQYAFDEIEAENSPLCTER